MRGGSAASIAPELLPRAESFEIELCLRLSGVLISQRMELLGMWTDLQVGEFVNNHGLQHPPRNCLQSVGDPDVS